MAVHSNLLNTSLKTAATCWPQNLGSSGCHS